MKSEKSPAPALERGLNILRFLESNESVTLEEIAQHEQAPKSSILRLLEVLIRMGLVVKHHQAKTYAACARLVFLQEQDGIDRDRLIATMQTLQQETNYTIEWFVPTEKGMVLHERVYPEDQTVFVKASVGFVREWNRELDSVAALGHVFFASPAIKWTHFWSYDRHAERVDLSRKQVSAILKEAKVARDACDPNPNGNGVQRIAVPVVRNEKAIGILSVAKTVYPKGGKSPEEIKEVLKQAAEKI